MRFSWVVCFGAIFLACQQSRDAVVNGTGQTALSLDGVEIRYEAHGSGNPALLFVHGWGCNRSYWEEQVKYFSPRHRVVAIDLPGHGESGSNRRDWTIDAFAADVAVVADQLNLEEMILIGHSMGGAVVAAAAVKMKGPVTGLIGVDTFQDISQNPTPAQVDSFLAPLTADYRNQTEVFVRGFLFNPDSDSALVERVVIDATAIPESIGIPTLRSLFRFDEAAAIRAAGIPLVCINSDKYPVNSDALEESAPSFQLKLMPGVSHYPMLEEPETFNRFLAEAIGSLSQE